MVRIIRTDTEAYPNSPQWRAIICTLKLLCLPLSVGLIWNFYLSPIRDVATPAAPHRVPADKSVSKNEALLLECPPSRTLKIDSSTSSFSRFINATLASLDAASSEITGNERPINFLVKNYDQYQSIQNGFWAEFGVFQGKTLLLAQNGLSRQKSFRGPIAGFDSFEGLPVKWRGRYDKGAFASESTNLYAELQGKVSSQVELYKGWFQDTILDFKAKHPQTPAACIHHDGDLFLSTSITLQLLHDRIKPGTHMIFDELIGYPDFDKHEILALWLWMMQHEATVCAMGHKGSIDTNSPKW
eukprot:CAMPEP_0172318038 /NCGR_PEP_ID=MMETSP1058-20130122/33715_1 /TAXON_ID=83371 /ORGANISM="Detonula confervacea, Strain CCMP 353" /LENGTH=299 /DNA_ID=CAMNT_0013032761 /DNA_START=262 /DNA_END=1158 /DNA_ORIENTATION=+